MKLVGTVRMTTCDQAISFGATCRVRFRRPWGRPGPENGHSNAGGGIWETPIQGLPHTLKIEHVRQGHSRQVIVLHKFCKGFIPLLDVQRNPVGEHILQFNL